MNFNRLIPVFGIIHFMLCTASIPLQASLYDQINDILDAEISNNGVPGMVVGIWRGGNEFAIYEKGYANLDLMTPISRNDTFRIGSVTKSFTVTRILQLADLGLLDLDDPIGNYFPGVQNQTATLRELANMTSGIFNYTENPDFTTELLLNLTHPRTNAEILAAAEDYSPYFAPGDGWHYTNTATVLLGMVIEMITGEDFGTQIHDHIIAPLGLTHTSYPADIFLPNPFANGYAIFDPMDGYTNISLSSPTLSGASGGMVSTLDDLHLWGKALAEGFLISPDAQFDRLQMVSATGIGPEYDDYGLGIGSIDGWIGHTGAYFGYQSLVLHDPTHEQTIVILTNMMLGNHVPTDIFRQISPLLAIPEPGYFSNIIAGAIMCLIYFLVRSRRRSFSTTAPQNQLNG